MKGGGSGSVLGSIQTLFDAGSATGMTDRQLLDQFLAREAPLPSWHLERSSRTMARWSGTSAAVYWPILMLLRMPFRRPF